MKIKFSKRAEKFLRNCEKEIYLRVIKKINELSENCFPQDTKRIQGEKGQVFRVRIGDYWILYEVHSNELIQIVHIDKRGRIY